MVPARRPWPGSQPPMMTWAWRVFLILIQSWRWRDGRPRQAACRLSLPGRGPCWRPARRLPRRGATAESGPARRSGPESPAACAAWCTACPAATRFPPRARRTGTTEPGRHRVGGRVDGGRACGTAAGRSPRRPPRIVMISRPRSPGRAPAGIERRAQGKWPSCRCRCGTAAAAAYRRYRRSRGIPSHLNSHRYRSASCGSPGRRLASTGVISRGIPPCFIVS